MIKIDETTAREAGSSLQGILLIASLVIVSVTAQLFMSGCSSPPKPPSDALQAAESAIANAEQDRVADYASPELSQAREKLLNAKLAVEKEQMTRARWLAEESKVQAELASARAAAAKAKAINDELQKGNNVLEQELQRNTNQP
jgi:hypothetical protein